MADVDFIEEIHIAQFWRKQLGEYEYVYYNPDDLRRWYIALETRGPEDIRSYLQERTGRYPPTAITGIVATAPHPPLDIVQLWLAAHNKIRTGPYWIALLAFGVFGFYTSTKLYGCVSLHDPNRLATHPPNMRSPLQTAGPNAPTVPLSTLPNPGPAPASTASPTATPSATPSTATHQ